MRKKRIEAMRRELLALNGESLETVTIKLTEQDLKRQQQVLKFIRLIDSAHRQAADSTLHFG